MQSSRDDERRLFEHFVVAGLDPSEPPELITPSAQECGCRNTQPLAPITDICVIFPSLGEQVPDNFEMISSSPLGYPADLNHGSVRMPSVFICYRRGYHKPPLLDIGVQDSGRGEKTMVDSTIVKTTPFGRPANVNNASQGIYITYRRASPNNAPSQFVVTHICVILANKGEIPPHTYYKIPKNLNKGMVGSDVYICYKKSQGTSKRLAYRPKVLDYFPRSVDETEFKLRDNIPMFCLPMGALIECWPSHCQAPEKAFTTFVLTDENGKKFYGAAVVFFEKYKADLTDEQMEQLDLISRGDEGEGGAVEDSSSNNDPAEQVNFYTNMAICIISRYPFFNSFKRFLFYLHRLSLTGGVQSVPIERYVSHLMYEVAFPTPRRPRVLVTLGAETISFDSTDDSQLPLSGAQLYDTLNCLGVDNLMYLMLLALSEQKILVHSLRPWMLTAVSESVCALMFPFHWQCPYIPQCPLGLAGVLHAPLPFIAGVDSRYFELYEDPPEDVTCFDLDTATISWSTVRQALKLSSLPKKPAKQLKNALESIYSRVSSRRFESTTRKADFVPVNTELLYQKQKREIEIEIQEAFLSAPAHANSTDTGNLFDLDGFLKSREKSSQDFFKKFSETQSFIRFIEERSFLSDKNTYNAFFDDCISRISLSDGDEIPLLESDSVLFSGSVPSVFIAPPEPLLEAGGTKEREFRYNGFPQRLDLELFQMDQLNRSTRTGSKTSVSAKGRCAAVRTKPEMKSSVLAAVNNVRGHAMQWPRTILFYAYSLWFMQLPSLLQAAPNKRKILRLAFHVLNRLERSGVMMLDEVCYRILIECCGDNKEPALAVKVLQAMDQTGLAPNAVTYGIYHRAVMDAEWPSETRTAACNAWSRLRLVVLGVYAFKGERVFVNTAATAGDMQSVLDPGYQSDFKATEADEDGAPFTITCHPLDDATTSNTTTTSNATPCDASSAMENAMATETDPLTMTDEVDPLGAFAKEDLKQSNDSLSRVAMSPSRARFLAEHDSTPFSTELTPKPEAKSNKSGGWLKGITSSPVFRMIRSTTFESPKPSADSESESSAPGLAVSPSLHSLVTHMKKGYDDVVKEGMSSRFRLGVSSLVQEVKSLKGNYGHGASGAIFGEDTSSDSLMEIDESDTAFLLDTGITGSILKEEWWLKEVNLQRKREQLREKSASVEGGVTEDVGVSGSSLPDGGSGGVPSIVDVTLSVCSVCPHCQFVVYDEEIMAGWKVDDHDLSTVCPHCSVMDKNVDVKNRQGSFTPSLTVEFNCTDRLRGSWYPPGGLDLDKDCDASTTPTAYKHSSLSVSFLSPLVLRRELETLLAADIHALNDPAIMESHPVVYWNLTYYMRRLMLPTHLNSWISSRHHVRCVYDRPSVHKDRLPLYFFNPNNQYLPDDCPKRTAAWKSVTDAVQANKLVQAVQTLVNESRTVMENGQVTLRPHFPIYRDIQFASLDLFGRQLIRDSLDAQYVKEYNLLPPRISQLMPLTDSPLVPVVRACRKVFMPLDLV